MTDSMTRYERCRDLGHPGATYNPLEGTTWCACGAVTYGGDQAGHITCCGGPLDDRPPRPEAGSGVATAIGEVL